MRPVRGKLTRDIVSFFTKRKNSSRKLITGFFVYPQVGGYFLWTTIPPPSGQHLPPSLPPPPLGRGHKTSLTPPSTKTMGRRAVRIPLECILVGRMCLCLRDRWNICYTHTASVVNATKGICCNCICLNVTLFWYDRYVNIPVLPNNLQIMADLGFGNRPPLILPARVNAVNVPDLLRKYVYINIIIVH